MVGGCFAAGGWVCVDGCFRYQAAGKGQSSGLKLLVLVDDVVLMYTDM